MRTLRIVTMFCILLALTGYNQTLSGSDRWGREERVGQVIPDWGIKDKAGKNWANMMLDSYKSIHGSLPDGVEAELLNRLQPGGYLYATFARTKTICDFVLVFKFDGDITTRACLKTGDELRWNFDGTIESEVDPNDLPGHILGTGDGILTVSTTDGWNGLTVFGINTNNFIEQTPKLWNAGLTELIYLSLYSNDFTSDMSEWEFSNSLVSIFVQSNSLVGDVSGWIIPSSVVNVYIYGNNFTGDLSSWELPASLNNLRVYGNNLNITGTFVTATLLTFMAQDNGLSEADVDRVLADYAAVAGVAGANLDLSKDFVINLGGTNAPPSAAGLTDKATLEGFDWVGGGGSITITVSS